MNDYEKLKATCKAFCEQFDKWRRDDWWDNEHWDLIPGMVDNIAKQVGYVMKESEDANVT